MAKNNTDEAELSALMSRVLSTPLAPIRDHSAKLEQSLMQAAEANRAQSLMILGSLEALTQTQQTMSSALSDLEDLPNDTRDLTAQIEELKGVVSTSEELKQLLKNQLRAQHVLGQQGHKQTLAKLDGHQQQLNSLGALVVENVTKTNIQLKDRMAESDAKVIQSLQNLEGAITAVFDRGESVIAQLDKMRTSALSLAQVQQALESQRQAIHSQSGQNQAQILSEVREGEKTQALLASDLSHLITDVNRQIDEGLQRSSEQVERALAVLGNREELRSRKFFKWLLALGIVNTAGVIAVAAWAIMQR